MKKMNKKILMIVNVVLLMAIMAVSVFASSQLNPIDQVVTGMNTSLADFSVANILKVVSAALALAIPLILAWFAFRWIYRRVKSAMKSGR